MDGLISKYYTVDEWLPDYLSKRIVVTLDREEGYVDEMKRILVYKALEMIEDDLEVTSITMTKVY